METAPQNPSVHSHLTFSEEEEISQSTEMYCDGDVLCFTREHQEDSSVTLSIMLRQTLE